jgi:hypothetical protein
MAKRKDARKKIQQPMNGEALRAAVAWILDTKIFTNLRLHGNTSWLIDDLILLAVVWVWSDDSTLTKAFVEARHWMLQVVGRVAVDSYQGLLKALVTWTATLLPLICQRLHLLMQKHGGAHWRVGVWLALAVDGSRVSVPRTKENEKAFCAPNYGKSNTAKYRRKKKKKSQRLRRKAKKAQPVKPQIWVTLLWHMGLQMPWSWLTGPSYASERDHFREMLAGQKFSANTLFCADAGFTGYELWKAIIDANHAFLIRVGANVSLLRKLGCVREKAGIVYFWPDSAARKKQAPLILRLLRLRVGRCQMHLVTNVLEEEQLTDQEAIRMYRLRWGVELQFRTVKQTFGRRKLRSRTPQRAYVELDWSLLGLWMIQLFAVKEQIKIGEIPEHCSVSLAIQIIRTVFQRWSETPDATVGKKLQAAIKDKYRRKRPKDARYKPNYKDKPAAGKPKIQNATKEQKARYQQYLNAAA